MTKAILMTLAACAAMLSACGKPAPSAANAAAAPAPVAANVAPGPVAAAPQAAGPAGPITVAELPAPTAGQWRRVSSQDGAAPETSTKCLDGKPIDPNEGGPPCASITAARTATGGFVVEGDCPNNGVSAKLRLSGEGDFRTSFTTDATMTMSGGGEPPMTMKNHSVWTYVGACPAGG